MLTPHTSMHVHSFHTCLKSMGCLGSVKNAKAEFSRKICDRVTFFG